ncbi:MAG: RNA-binding domain-containing protein [Bacillota bacterium]
MRSVTEIRQLLDELNTRSARELEAQDLDFKEWRRRSADDAARHMVDMAVCMVNGGGGTVVFGVSDKEAGRAAAIQGVPLDVDINQLKKAVYDSTDPELTPVFEELYVSEGTGRLIVMQVYPGRDSASLLKMTVFFGQYETNWGVVFAGMLLASLPLLVLYLLMSRQFIKGLTAGAVKG